MTNPKHIDDWYTLLAIHNFIDSVECGFGPDEDDCRKVIPVLKSYASEFLVKRPGKANTFIPWIVFVFTDLYERQGSDHDEAVSLAASWVNVPVETAIEWFRGGKHRDVKQRAVETIEQLLFDNRDDPLLAYDQFGDAVVTVDSVTSPFDEEEI